MPLATRKGSARHFWRARHQLRSPTLKRLLAQKKKWICAFVPKIDNIAFWKDDFFFSSKLVHRLYLKFSPVIDLLSTLKATWVWVIFWWRHQDAIFWNPTFTNISTIKDLFLLVVGWMIVQFKSSVTLIKRMQCAHYSNCSSKFCYGFSIEYIMC